MSMPGPPSGSGHDGIADVSATPFAYRRVGRKSTRTQITQQTRGNLSLFIDNMGNAESTGIELQLRARLPVSVTAAVVSGYTDSRTASDFERYNGTIEAGQRLPGPPYLTGSATLAYTAEVGSALFDTSVTGPYQGNGFNDLMQTRVVDGYTAHSFKAGPQWPGPSVRQPSLNPTTFPCVPAPSRCVWA